MKKIKFLQKKEKVKEEKKPAVKVTEKGVVLDPVRRFAARAFDYILLVLIVTWCMALSGMYMGSFLAGLLPLILALVVMFALEPLLLWRLGTTPGKALLGLYVTKKGNVRLTYMEGISRMDTLYTQGIGWGFPVWSQIRMWHCFRKGLKSKEQRWDSPAPIRQRPGKRTKWWALFIAGCVVMTVADTVVMRCSELPGNRGDLTVAEFSENFNRQTNVWGIAFWQVLDENGQWQYRENSVSASGGAPTVSELPMEYTVEDGRITAIRITNRSEGAEKPLRFPNNHMVVLVSSYVWAQKDAPLLGNARMSLLSEMLRNGLGDHAYQQAGVSITVDTETEGFDVVDGKLQPQEGAEKYEASYTITLQLAD